jgi:hypothetical protein
MTAIKDKEAWRVNEWAACRIETPLATWPERLRWHANTLAALLERDIVAQKARVTLLDPAERVALYRACDELRLRASRIEQEDEAYERTKRNAEAVRAALPKIEREP